MLLSLDEYKPDRHQKTSQPLQNASLLNTSSLDALNATVTSHETSPSTNSSSVNHMTHDYRQQISSECNNNTASCTSGTGSDVDSAEAGACAGCGSVINDRHFLVVSDKQWHIDCLRCASCQQTLECDFSCFTRDGEMYCKEDYIRKFSVKTCACCAMLISSSDIVMKTRDHVYHEDCFSCAVCHKILRKGDQCGMRDHFVFCKTHYETCNDIPMQGHGRLPLPHCGMTHAQFFPATINPPQKGRPRKQRKTQHSNPDNDLFGHTLEYGPDGFPLAPQRQKRMRTSFKHNQLRVLKTYFDMNSNPDSKELNNLAEKTGLSKRVLQVWFQNSRAKQRRNTKDGGGSSSSGIVQAASGGERQNTKTSSSRVDSPHNNSENTENSFSELHDETSQSPRPALGQACTSDVSTSSMLDLHINLKDIDRDLSSSQDLKPFGDITHDVMSSSHEQYTQLDQQPPHHQSNHRSHSHLNGSHALPHHGMTSAVTDEHHRLNGPAPPTSYAPLHPYQQHPQPAPQPSALSELYSTMRSFN